MKILNQKNYLASIFNSIGSTQYKNLWVLDKDNHEVDILKNGQLSCAVFVTSILKLYDLIDKKHATVDSTIKSMLDFGWKEITQESIEPGDVIVWNKRIDKNDQQHGHIGFYVGDEKAVSNSTKLCIIVRHGWTYGGRRKIVKVLRWDKW